LFGYYTNMITLKYTLFAIISTIINLLFQYLSLKIYPNGFASLYLAMSIGTLSGLIIKYILDKNFIFYHKTKDKKDDKKKFLLYSVMGIFTTMIFWITEIIFNHLFDLKYLGAIIGLGIGYIIKYFLDKKFVFVDKIL